MRTARRGETPESPRQQGRLGGGQESARNVSGLGVRGPASGLGIGGGQIWAERDAADVVDAGPAQPVLQVRLLEEPAETRAPVGTVDRPGVDDGGPLVLQQAGVARGGVEAETMPGWLTTSMNCLRM
jgi:hypothetical protein